MSAENPADAVIEAAAEAICRVHCGRMFVERNGRACNQHQRDGEVAVRALSDAGLLATPADQDNAADQVTANAVCHLLGERLRRAEAERDLLRAQVAAVRALADEWRYRPHPEGAESVSDWTYRMHEQSLGSLLGLALDTAGGERP